MLAAVRFKAEIEGVSAVVYSGELFKTLSNGTEIYRDGDTYYSVNEDGTYTRYTYSQCIKSCYDEAVKENERVFKIVSSVQNNKNASDNTISDDIQYRIYINKLLDGNDDDEEPEVEEESKYKTDNVVAVTYGNDDGTPYKTVILNYNNYAIKITHDGIVYTIAAYGFVVIDEK